MKEYAKKFYNSRAWKKCRESYFKSKYGLCERCSGPGKIVHHKRYITPYNINNHEITLNHSNLELLCQTCHNKEHNEKYSPTVEGVTFDDQGMLVEVRK
ncbi:HNH endonuclease [Micromonospora provocatoris]